MSADQMLERTVDSTAAMPTPQPMSRQVTRTPLYFDSGSHRLFGWYHAPAVVAPTGLGVLLCAPLGHEYISSHRSLRHLADRLAAAGVPVLRFDYDGTGNSSGLDTDLDRVSVWKKNIRDALATLRDLSGCARVGVVGLRTGATLAALVAEEVELSCAVLWAPCVRGRAFIREMKAMQLSNDDRAHTASIIEAGGFQFTEHTVRDLSQLDLSAALPKVQRLLIAARDDLNQDFGLRDRWLQRGLKVEQRQLPGYVEMLGGTAQSTIVPHDAIGQIVSWVMQNESPSAGVGASIIRGGSTDLPTEIYIHAHAADRDIKESHLSFGVDGKLFGIMSEPGDAIPDTRPTILLLNSGSVHHVGPNRVYVLLARQLARAGFRCVRMDFSGLGDSVIDDLDNENKPYLSTASAEIAMAVAALQQRGVGKSFTLMGLCSGAHASFHGGLELTDLPIVECALINPLTFYWKEGMPLDEPTLQHFSAWRWYMKAIRDPRSWANLLRGKADIANVIGTVVRQVRIVISTRWGVLRKKVDSKTASVTDNQLTVDVRRLVEARRQLTFVFARSDPGYDLLMTDAGATVKRLTKEGRISIASIENANHTFSNDLPRRDMIAWITRHFATRYH